MFEYLFVYGTLLSTALHPMGDRLAREGRRIGPATIRGRLFDLGKWPGLADSTAPEDVVHGEVYALPDPDRMFAWLDIYEGIRPGEVISEYIRTRRSVRVHGLQAVETWVYLYQWPIKGAPRIDDGRWRPRASWIASPALAAPSEIVAGHGAIPIATAL